MAAPQETKSKTRLVVWFAVAVALVLGVWAAILALGALAFSSASTSLTRKDFATEASARAFVDEHLPVALPTSVAVRSLAYERFTDWHLDTRLEFGTAMDADAYLRNAHLARQLNVEYCGNTDDDRDAGAGNTVSYFLPKSFACGSLSRGSQPTQIRVECYTR
jgi:hypothetical protein